MGLGRVLGYVASAALLFLGVIFLLASMYAVSRLLVGTVLTLAGLAIAVVTWRAGVTQPSVKYEIQTSGTLRAESLRCPNCGAGLDPSTMQLKAGAPMIMCPYCGKESEVTEEPKW